MASKYQLITAMYEEVCKEVARDKSLLQEPVSLYEDAKCRWDSTD